MFDIGLERSHPTNETFREAKAEMILQKMQDDITVIKILHRLEEWAEINRMR